MAEKRDMVQIASLEKYFGEDKERVHVLKGVTLNIPEGSLYTFLGPSGCGKTTTLRCVAGLERFGRASLRANQQAADRDGVSVLRDLAAYDCGGKRRLSADHPAPS